MCVGKKKKQNKEQEEQEIIVIWVHTIGDCELRSLLIIVIKLWEGFIYFFYQTGTLTFDVS